MQEFEAHFLNIDVATTRKKLEQLGATLVMDANLKEEIFDQDVPGWRDNERMVRVRWTDKGGELTYKETIAKNQLGGRLEIETLVKDPDSASLIMKKLGLILVRVQEKRRITYKFENLSFDIDFWPNLPPYIEIESDNEAAVREAASKLGFDWKDVCLFDAQDILEKVYGIKDYDRVKAFTFDRLEYYDKGQSRGRN